MKREVEGGRLLPSLQPPGGGGAVGGGNEEGFDRDLTSTLRNTVVTSTLLTLFIVIFAISAFLYKPCFFLPCQTSKQTGHFKPD